MPFSDGTVNPEKLSKDDTSSSMKLIFRYFSTMIQQAEEERSIAILQTMEEILDTHLSLNDSRLIVQ